MEDIIRRARTIYPKDQTQQFYGIIKPFLDTAFANSNEANISNDSYEDPNGIKVIRQFFVYSNQKFCFWICLFPYLTEDGKKNAWYGIDKLNIISGVWQALWSEADNNIQLWLKLRIVARLTSEEEFYAINPFEAAIKNAEYDSDIFEQRKIIAEIVMDYGNAGGDEHRHKEVCKGSTKFKFEFFRLLNCWYLWTDFYVDNLLEGFRLDVIYNVNTSFVLFSNLANDDQLYITSILKLLKS